MVQTLRSISFLEQDTIYSAVDIMLDNVPENEVIDGQFMAKNVLLNTQYPNLKTISAFPEDAMFNAEAWQDLSTNGSLDIVKLLKEKVIDPINFLAVSTKSASYRDLPTL